MSKHLKYLPSTAQAFSLVEVVLAIGIVAFAFIALIGLLPTGLTTFRKAIDTSLSAQIIQRVANEASQTDFDKLENFVLHFDEQGNVVEIGDPMKLYDVSVAIRKQTDLPKDVVSPNLASLAVQIAYNPMSTAPDATVTTASFGGSSTATAATQRSVSVRNVPLLVSRSH